MQYEQIQHLPPAQFKRLTGVTKDTFALMVSILTESLKEARPISGRTGRPPALGIADQLLLTLTYWREYRTLFHLAQSFGVSEATACRIVRRVENRLIQDDRLHLPGKKVLRPSDVTFDVVVVDVTESQIERPKK